MIEERKIVNSQYSVNIDIATDEEIRNLIPELGALIISTIGILYVGNGSNWVAINQR
jgi:hypothetical protein